MRLELEGVRVCVAGREERSSTSIANASAYVVIVITVLMDRAVTLVSCYLANLGGETAVSHLLVAPGHSETFSQRVLSGLTGQSHARACLLDHAAELRDVLAELEDRAKVSVDVDDCALQLAAGVWRRRVTG